MKLYIAVFFCILTVCISVLVVVPNSATIKLGRVTITNTAFSTMHSKNRLMHVTSAAAIWSLADIAYIAIRKYLAMTVPLEKACSTA